MSQSEPVVAPPHPRTVAFWVARIFLAALIALVGWSGWRLASKLLGGGTDRLLRDTDRTLDSDKITPTPRPVVYDEAWEKKMRAEIAALDSEVQAAKDAYARQETASKSRTFSREDDRKELTRLNQVVLSLEQRRAETAAALAEHAR